MALRDGVNLTIEKNFQMIIMEIDSKEMHLILTNIYNKIDWRIRPVVLDFQKLQRLVLDSIVVLIKREVNASTYWVAVNTRKGMCLSG
ncbi:hypothetical protein CRYUN_Cryun38cG0020400 [Craigia yunnanensis]